MRILIVNDDGIEAPGIALLAEAAAQLGEVTVAAPDRQCSGMSQKLTLFEPITVRPAGFPVKVKAAWSVGGTPADCVKLALSELMDARPDYIFSGVNDGYNAGFDVAYSGTIGACMESVMNGIPAIAFSAPNRGDMQTAREYLLPVAKELIAAGAERGEFYNVNFPSGAAPCRGILRERRPAQMQMYRDVFRRSGTEDGGLCFQGGGVLNRSEQAGEGTDVAALFEGFISVGRIRSPLVF